MAAYYFDTLKQHNEEPLSSIVGAISISYSKEHLDQKQQQTITWEDTVSIFKDFYAKSLNKIIHLPEWKILYEYKIPRRAKKIDVVLLSKNLIFVIEVKNKQKQYSITDKRQLEDYCLDLRDFHFQSKDKVIIPILLCTDAADFENDITINDDFVQEILLANRHSLANIISTATSKFSNIGSQISVDKWNKSSYFPTPTIIEAAQTLYANQTVNEITRNHAGLKNLTKTTNAIISAIKDAQTSNHKIICFITGVPGAGKTLAGLNIVHNQDFQTSNNKELGVFLSGNSPLVKVLSEALARDLFQREKILKPEAQRRVKTFIHNVHEFIDEYYVDKTKIPVDRVLIYDEAQRAWTKEHKTKKSNGQITESEPEILLSIMDRFLDWGVIIALVGGGQEINTGEAGLREWGKTIESKFKDWKVYISPELLQGELNAGDSKLFEELPKNVTVVESKYLHLNVAIRSYKAKELSDWVALTLQGKSAEAKELFQERLKNYPIFITRDINIAKDWLRKKSRGTRRTGVVASSGGRRLKAHGYDPFYGLRGDSSQDELGAWYLNPTTDIRSSNFLEIIATEYAVQGLELDWVGLFWDADFKRENQNWDFKQFKGTKWQKVNDKQRMQFILNKYRVLLTRAREGMVIWVPMGDENDETRLPSFYDETFTYLTACGVNILNS